MAKIEYIGSPSDIQTYGDKYDRPWYEDAYEIGRQGIGGLADITRQSGQIIRRVAPEDSPMQETGLRIARAGEEWQQNFEPDTLGEGAVAGTLAQGLRGVVGAAPSIGATIINPALGAAVAAGQFGISQAQDTEDKLRAQGISPQQAREAGYYTGGTQGLGEAAATYLTGGLYRAARPAAGAAMKAIAGQALDTRVAMPYAKEVLKNAIFQPLTEIGQDVTTSKIEEAYGARPEDLVSIAKQSGQGALGMTFWTSLMGVPGAVGRAKTAQLYNYALTDPSAPIELRDQAVSAITDLAKEAKVHPDAILQWVTQQTQKNNVQGDEINMLTPPATTGGLEGALARTPTPLPASAFTQPSAQRDLFGTVGGPAPIAGEQLDMFGAGGRAADQVTDPRQGDLFAPEEPSFKTRITAGLLDSLGMPRQSPMYRQLLGKDMADPAVQPQVAEIFGRVRNDPTISARTKAGIEGLAMNAFGGMARQQEMFGPKGGAYPQGRPSTQQNAPGPIENILPTQPLGEAVNQPVAEQPVIQQTTPTPTAVAMPTVPNGVKLTTEETRALKQAQSVFDITETDAERKHVVDIANRIVSRAAARSGISNTTSTTEGTTRGAQTPKTEQTKTQGQEFSAAESEYLSKSLEDIDNMDIGGVLPASVKSSSRAVPGRMSIGQDVLKKIRNALVQGKEVADEKTQRIVDALHNFAETYNKYLNASTQGLSRRTEYAEGYIHKDKTPAQYAEHHANELEFQAQQVRAALAELGDAVGGNAKDVEAVVRLVKDMVQGKIASTTDKNSEAAKKLASLDTRLSMAWADAKRETFMPEEPNLANVRGNSLRQAMEQQGKTAKLEQIAKEGRVVEAGQRVYGLPAILHYLRKHGTPMEKTLALALRETLVGQGAGVKLEFIKDGKSRFDPATNTVYLSKEESPEVILHEAFHAALQSFVYKNPNHPAVVQLKKSLHQVVTYKGKLTGKALDVQNLLKGLVAKGNELDAVLELVSYGTTLNEFRKALEGMKGDKSIPPSFLSSVNKAWAAIKNLATRILGGRQSLASDVLQSSFELLDNARFKAHVGGEGRTLEAAIRSTLPQNQSDKVNLQKYQDTPGWSVNITRSVLEHVGFGENGKIDKKVTAAFDNAAAKLTREFPGLAKNLRMIASGFGLSADYKLSTSTFKQEKQTGLVEVEGLMARLYRNPVDAIRVLTYLNGDKSALKDTGSDVRLRDTADAIYEHFDSYVKTLSVQDQRMFEGLKFTDYLLKPQSLADLAKKSFGMHSVQAIFRPFDRVEKTIDEFKSLLPFTDGVLDTSKPLYQVFETVGGKRGPLGFIDAELANQHPELDIDRSRVWYFTGKKKGADGGFNFRTRNLSGANLLDVARRLGDPRLSTQEKDEAIQQISSAMLTTMAALSHNAATSNLFAGLAPMGRAEDGKATETTVVFNSIDEINSVFKDRVITKDNLLEAADDESKIKKIRGTAQRGDVWVKLPNTDHYGPLRGKIISGGVWSNMLDMHDRAPLVDSETLNNLMTAFKKNKTVFSPATHANNIVTNYALMLLHGISHKTLGDAANLIWRYELNPSALTDDQRALMKEFYKSGAVLGQFTNAETKSYLAKKLEQNITQQNERSLLTKLAGWAGYEKAFSEYASKVVHGGKYAESVFSEVYAAGDNVFRLAAFMNVAGTLQAKNGGKLGEEQLKEAGRAARGMFLDYDIDARLVRAARQSVLPFVSWSYAILPVLGRLAITKPWAMVNMMAALYAMGMFGDDDEWRKHGPEAVRERSLGGYGPYNFIRFPFMGTDENPMYFNIGKSIPMMSLFEPAQGKSHLFGQNYIPGSLNFSGPYVTLLGNSLLNVDPFTGKSLYNETTDDYFTRAMKISAATWDTFAPSIATTRFLNQAINFSEEKKGPTGRPVDGLAIARTFGLSIYQYDKGETQFYQNAEVRKIRSEFSAAMNKAKRDELSRGYPDYEALDKELANLRTHMEKEIAKKRGEEE